LGGFELWPEVFPEDWRLVLETPSPPVARCFLVLFSLLAGYAPVFCEVFAEELLVKEIPLNYSPRFCTFATPTFWIDPDELDVPRVAWLPGRTKLFAPVACVAV
jgi:hypothetical protein